MNALKFSKKKAILLCLAAFILAVFAFCVFQLYRSYHCLTVSRYEYETDKLEAPVHAVLLADLHDHEFGERNIELVQQVQKLEPDVIFMDGDFINEASADSHVVLELVEQLATVAPVYYAIGNNELDYMEQRDQGLMGDLAAAGAIVMDLDYCDAELNGQTIRIGGMYDYAFALDGRDSTRKENMKPEVYNFLTEFQDTELLTVMLSHRPDSFVLGEAAATWRIDLILNGHTHGGQVILPFLGGLWAPEQGWLPEYDYGLFEKENLDILITRGLGSQVRLIPRFNNPPEIVSLMLTPAEMEE